MQLLIRGNKKIPTSKSFIKTQGRAFWYIFLSCAKTRMTKIWNKLIHTQIDTSSRCAISPKLWVVSSIREKDILIISFTAQGMGAALIFQKGAGERGKPNFFLFKAKVQESQWLSFMTGPVLKGREQLMVLLWAALLFSFLHKESHVRYLDMVSFVQKGTWLLFALLHPTVILAQQEGE